MEPLLRGEHGYGSSADEGSPGVVTRGRSTGGRTGPPDYQSTATRRRNGGDGDGAGEGAGAGADSATAASSRHHRPVDSRPALMDEKWWTRLLASFQSIELENKGSVARDHLALENLSGLAAYFLAFASIGVAITQLFRLNTSLAGNQGDKNAQTMRRVGKPLGATFLAISIVMLFLGYNRYRTSQQWILRGKFPASRGTVILVSLMAFALMIASLVVVIVVQPSAVLSIQA